MEQKRIHIGLQLTDYELGMLDKKVDRQRRSRASVATEALLKYLGEKDDSS